MTRRTFECLRVVPSQDEERQAQDPLEHSAQ
jgi:hypothetical protein